MLSKTNEPLVVGKQGKASSCIAATSWTAGQLLCQNQGNRWLREALLGSEQISRLNKLPCEGAQIYLDCSVEQFFFPPEHLENRDSNQLLIKDHGWILYQKWRQLTGKIRKREPAKIMITPGWLWSISKAALLRKLQERLYTVELQETDSTTITCQSLNK